MRRLAILFGPGVVLVLAVPVLLAVAPLLGRHRARRVSAGIAASLTLAFCLVAAASVGMLYLPSALALAVAAALPEPAEPGVVTSPPQPTKARS
ncbi:MAG TPA: hypothetical protein VFY16_05215 [Gemmatimonadaceae bacterium]|nr:hypothetical protein [Gemmatimonadaceae bacterium]